MYFLAGQLDSEDETDTEHIYCLSLLQDNQNKSSDVLYRKSQR